MPISPASPPQGAASAALDAGVRRWLFALGVAVFGIGARILAQPLLDEALPFVFAFPATAFAAVMWGSGPGLLTGALCALAAASPLLLPNLAASQRPVEVGAFVISAILICLIGGSFGRRPVVERETAPAGEGDTPLTLWLRAVLWGAFLVPAAIFALAAWWGYERSNQDARDAVAHASALALSHAEKTIAVAAQIAHRADEAAAGPDASVRELEGEVHQRLADIATGVPGVLNLNVWDAQGRPLAGSDNFPVDPRATVADRAYFVQHRTPGAAVGISAVLTGRQSGLELMNATIRRHSADGTFNGIVAVSLAPSYFRDYYRSLISQEPNLASFALVRTDGALLARWPPAPAGQREVAASSPILRRVRAGELAGSLVLPESGPREARLASFRRVGAYPLYVVAGVSDAGTLADWVRFVWLLAAVLAPTTAGLVYVSWVALKRTRREQAMSAQLREQIRRRANAERAMLETQKLETLAQLTAGVAHDFNNLLAIVSNSLHVHRRLHPDIGSERQIEAMSRAVQSGVRLTRQLLSFSRKQALRPETVRLQSWLPATESLVRGTLGRRIALEFSIDAETRPVVVDLAELELAIINTALNAQHAMPDGGTLRISARNADVVSGSARPMVVIRVEDNGCGIAPELLPKVFEPFFTTKESGSGSGLGLSQVAGLCAQAGGLATIESKPGQGTAVNLFLPAAVEALATLADEPGPSAPLVGRVLLVEDNDDVATATETLLRTFGLEVVRTWSADAALEHLAQAPRLPDVVLSDISMPGSTDGIGLAFALRRQHPELPVLLTTGYAERLSEALAGGFRVLAKPATPQAIMHELRQLLNGHASAPPAARQSMPGRPGPT